MRPNLLKKKSQSSLFWHLLNPFIRGIESMIVAIPMHTSSTGVVVLCHQPVIFVSAWGLRYLTLKIQQFPRTFQAVLVWGSLLWPLTAFCQSQFTGRPCQFLHSFSMATSSWSVAPSVVSGFCLGNLVFCLILVLGHPMAANDWAEASSPYLGRDLCGRWDSPLSIRVWFRIVGTVGSGL